MTENPLHRLMLKDITAVSSANCILARMWRLLLISLDVHAPIWENLLNSYTQDCKPHIGKAKAENRKGNIPERLASDVVTWGYFCIGISVFNFKDVIFSVKLNDGNKEETIELHIPRTLGGDTAIILTVLWEKIRKAFPDKANNWHTLYQDFATRAKENGEVIPSYLKGNLTRALGEGKLTWANLYRGLVIYHFEQITFTLKVKRRGQDDYELHTLNLHR